jgi:hypothetical protein
MLPGDAVAMLDIAGRFVTNTNLMPFHASSKRQSSAHSKPDLDRDTGDDLEELPRVVLKVESVSDLKTKINQTKKGTKYEIQNIQCGYRRLCAGRLPQRLQQE